MFKCVIFDMDGVIIDSEHIHCQVSRYVLNSIGFSITKEEYDDFAGTTSEAFWSHMKERFKFHQSVREMGELEDDIYLKYVIKQDSLEPIHGVVELIKDFDKNKVNLAVASSAVLKSINTVVDKFKLTQYFKVLVGAECIKRSKPDPEVFLCACEKLGAAPEECIVIEDSRNGVQAAKSAGMRCIGYKNYNSGNQDLTAADLKVTSFEEIDYNKLKKLYEKWCL